MASAAPPADITAAYRAGLANTVATALAVLTQLWARLYDPTPGATLGSLATIGAGAATWTAAAQRAATSQAAAYLEASFASLAGVPRASVEPFATRLDLVGTSASGRPLTDMTGQAPAVYLNRLERGWSEADAAASSAAWLNRLTASEPMRVANETIRSAAELDDRLAKRFVRVTAPGACAFCILIRDRGYTAANVGFAAHANCRCTAGPEIELDAARGAAADRRDGFLGDIDRLSTEIRDLNYWGPDAYGKVKEIGDLIDAEVRRRLGGTIARLGYDGLTRYGKEQYNAEVWRVLADVRTFGGTLDITTRRSPGVAMLRQAAAYYPADWLKRSNEHWRSLSVSYGQARGQYSPADGRIRLSSWSKNVDVHELFHRMEHVNPIIKAVEYQFWVERATLGGTLEKVSPIYAGTSEVGIKDKFTSHYQGKAYGTPSENSFYELGSTGMEWLARNNGAMMLDYDYMRFLMGMLAGL